VILGIGSDICDVRRIERSLARFGRRFMDRIFTETEIAKGERRQGTSRAGAYAKRFAAKEACAKALGTGFAKGVHMSDLGVENLPGGQPVMVLAGGAAARLATMVPPGMAGRIDLTMTDEYPYAYAHVIISAVPAPGAPTR
jgi:holo-[acyl-carrier protein] synthase